MVDLSDVIHEVTLGTRSDVDRLQSKCLVRGTLGGASHVVQFLVQFKLLVLAPFNILIEVVRVNILAVQVAENSLKCFLGTPHVAVHEVLAYQGAVVDLRERVADLFGFEHLASFVALVLGEQIHQVAEKTNLRLAHSFFLALIYVVLKRLLQEETVDLFVFRSNVDQLLFRRDHVVALFRFRGDIVLRLL